jgi:hypothetical protein
MVQAIRHENGLEMPPGERLKSTDVDRIVRWIRSGMYWPEIAAKSSTRAKDGSFTDEQRKFWSFRPLKNVTPPQVHDQSWARSAVDRFILAALESHGLKPAKQAEKRTLLRRATFDLTGLPPTPEEIALFLNDDSADAFAKVVERLLASPQYGERWGRHWLDVVRYTDSFDVRILNGEGSIMDVTEAYRYRDWVVNAFNQDLPYDEFIVNQIGGDLIPLAAPDQVNAAGIIATGMLAIGNWGGGDADKEKLLTDIVDDQIDVVSRAFLGITMACARCHDHKFDPFTTEDYYALAGIFFSTHILADPGPKTNGPPMLRIPLASKAELERRKQIQDRIVAIEKEMKLMSGPTATSAGSNRLLALKAELGDLRQTALAPLSYANGVQEGGCPKSPQAGIHDVHVHIRGRYDRLGPTVPRRFPMLLASEEQAPHLQGSGRMELAHWIAGPTNPLTARVIVNRIWQHHFGEGIVRTPGNFGKLGEPPSHPELLDYLAGLLIRSGWSMKALHRTIMLSAAYQQSSVQDPEMLRRDPDNRWFGRINRRRLEAEELRDSLLATAGRLHLTMGGRATRDFQQPRRSLYLMTVRSDRSSFRELFDAADPTAITDKRVVSTVAPQALFLLNHPFVLEQAGALVKRVAIEGGNDSTARLTRLYLLLFGRPPDGREVSFAMTFLNHASHGVESVQCNADAAWLQYCQALLCANEFVYVD